MNELDLYARCICLIKAKFDGLLLIKTGKNAKHLTTKDATPSVEGQIHYQHTISRGTDSLSAHHQ